MPGKNRSVLRALEWKNLIEGIIENKEETADA